jgi:hypothetical protein
MRIAALVLAATVIAGSIGGAAVPAIAQAPAATTAPVEFTGNYGALFYYKTTQEAFDVAAAAAMSKDVQMASPFDKAKRQVAEEERFRKGLETVND